MPNFFVKKPIKIEALQYNGTNIKEIKDFVGMCVIESMGASCFYHIFTLEGTSYNIGPGDWIIKGVRGEFYPCKDDIFQMTYDKVSE